MTDAFSCQTFRAFSFAQVEFMTSLIYLLYHYGPCGFCTLTRLSSLMYQVFEGKHHGVSATPQSKTYCSISVARLHMLQLVLAALAMSWSDSSSCWMPSHSCASEFATCWLLNFQGSRCYIGFWGSLHLNTCFDCQSEACMRRSCSKEHLTQHRSVLQT